MTIPFFYITHAQYSFDQIKLIKDILTIFHNVSKEILNGKILLT